MRRLHFIHLLFCYQGESPALSYFNTFWKSQTAQLSATSLLGQKWSLSTCSNDDNRSDTVTFTCTVTHLVHMTLSAIYSNAQLSVSVDWDTDGPNVCVFSTPFWFVLQTAVVGLGVAAIWLLHSRDPCLLRPAEGTEEPGRGEQRTGSRCGHEGGKIGCSTPCEQGHKSSHTSTSFLKNFVFFSFLV